jgi:trehalose/maltose transport system permease protein
MTTADPIQHVSSFDPWKLVKKTAFYLLVLFIVVVMVFPFYYAILTSFKSGTNLFIVTYWPQELNFANYLNVLQSAAFLQNFANSIVVATLTVLLSLLGVSA